MRFSRYNPAQLEPICLATDDGLGCCYVLTERIRVASEELADDARQAFTDDLHRATRQSPRPLSRDDAVEFIARPVCIVDGHKPIKPKAKKTRAQFARELRRGVYHTLVRLPANRREAKATRRKVGNQSRQTVYPLIREAIRNGTPRHKVRAEVTRLAAVKGVRIVADWQLGRIIKGFFEVDTTT